MKKFSIVLLITTLTAFFLFSFTDLSFSQTVDKAKHLLADNLSAKKVYIVDSVSLFAFVESKENEKKIEAYFEDRNMPLSAKAEKFIEVAKKYNLDPFLLPSISIKESTGGKFLFKSFNAFGFGQRSFESFDEAIEYVGDKLTNGKYYKGKSLKRKLLTYNSEQKKYYLETLKFMDNIKNQKIDKIDPMIYVDSFKIEKPLDIKVSSEKEIL